MPPHQQLMTEIRTRADAPTVECQRCHRTLRKLEEVEVDTWNLGDYGCTYETCPRIHVRWITPECPHCKAELTQRLEIIDSHIADLKKRRDRMIQEFWHEST